MATLSRLNSAAPEYVPPSTAPATPQDARHGLSVRLPSENDETPRRVAKRVYCTLDRVPFTPGKAFKTMHLIWALAVWGLHWQMGLQCSAGSGVVTPGPMSANAATAYYAQNHEGQW